MIDSEKKYEVYELENGKHHHIAWCENSKTAEIIAYCIAKCNPKGNEYFTSYNAQPGELVPGGGGYVSFRKNKDGKVERCELS